MDKAITSADAMLEFLIPFSWWEIRRTNSGTKWRVIVGVRLACGEYVKVYGRLNEPAHGVAERLRNRLLEEGS